MPHFMHDGWEFTCHRYILVLGCSFAVVNYIFTFFFNAICLILYSRCGNISSAMMLCQLYAVNMELHERKACFLFLFSYFTLICSMEFLLLPIREIDL